jgi:hypothetical protein
MFPARDDLPTVADDNDIVPTESNNRKETKETRKSLICLCFLIIQ